MTTTFEPTETAVLVGDTTYDVVRATTGGYHAYIDDRVAGRGPTIDAAVDDAVERECDYDRNPATRTYKGELVCRGCCYRLAFWKTNR